MICVFRGGEWRGRSMEVGEGDEENAKTRGVRDHGTIVDGEER